MSMWDSRDYEANEKDQQKADQKMYSVFIVKLERCHLPSVPSKEENNWFKQALLLISPSEDSNWCKVSKIS